MQGKTAQQPVSGGVLWDGGSGWIPSLLGVSLLLCSLLDKTHWTIRQVYETFIEGTRESQKSGSVWALYYSERHKWGGLFRLRTWLGRHFVLLSNLTPAGHPSSRPWVRHAPKPHFVMFSSSSAVGGFLQLQNDQCLRLLPRAVVRYGVAPWPVREGQCGFSEWGSVLLGRHFHGWFSYSPP